MIIKTAEFIKSAVNPSQYPDLARPEIAFVGRSNVGKSSLINVLVNRKRLVKTSSTPGRTQLINFFDINQAFLFVDLPGYGYAKVPRHVKKNWAPMVEQYFAQKRQAKGIVFIFDLRRTPRDEDLDLYDWFNRVGIPLIPVITKADKLSKSKQKQQLFRIADILNTPGDDLVLFSSKTRQGKDRLWEEIGLTLEVLTPLTRDEESL